MGGPPGRPTARPPGRPTLPGVRVVAGTARGRRLAAPPGTDVRPTSDRVREAVFNALGSLDALAGARVLDLFAGTGALGIEALSRGAAAATFVERDGRARRVVKDNLRATGLDRAADVVGDDASRFLRRQPAGGDPRYQLVLLDPPYSFDDWSKLLDDLEAVVDPAGLVVIESGEAREAPTWAEMVRMRRYGSTVVTIVRRLPPTPTEPCS